MLQKIKPYIIPTLIPIAVGALAALITRGSMDIYSEINTPPLSPPAWLFPVVWTVLYTLMGICSGIVYRNRNVNPEAAKSGLTYYAVSLVLNFAWTVIFFNFRYFLLSLAVLLALLYTIIRTVLSYRPVSKAAAYLQIPYALWVGFATYLNAGIWYLN